MDAAHFIHGAFLGFLWSLCRVFVPSPAGRKRFNVLGALDAVTKEIITVTNTSYINSKSVCEILEKINTQARKPGELITIVLDNAKYQRCRLVQEYAEELKIELLFLPAYSPNLNLIERLWRFVKKDCLYSRYYEKFDTFKNAITESIENADKNELESLLTLKFQLFDDVYISTV